MKAAFMADEVALNKATIIEPCLQRVREVHAGNDTHLLERAELIPPEIARAMRPMVGFRNVAVHSYRELDLEIVRSVLHERLPDFEAFTSHVLRSLSAPASPK